MKTGYTAVKTADAKKNALIFKCPVIALSRARRTSAEANMWFTSHATTRISIRGLSKSKISALEAFCLFETVLAIFQTRKLIANPARIAGSFTASLSARTSLPTIGSKIV
jgi:hypothetical protein